MAPTISFTAEDRSGNLMLQVVSCSDLPDKDALGIGFGNKSDPYVKVRVGNKEEKTETADSLSPSFKAKHSTFHFDVRGSVVGTTVNFEVMDKDTFTKDDFLGTATVTLTSDLV